MIIRVASLSEGSCDIYCNVKFTESLPVLWRSGHTEWSCCTSASAGQKNILSWDSGRRKKMAYLHPVPSRALTLGSQPEWKPAIAMWGFAPTECRGINSHIGSYLQFRRHLTYGYVNEDGENRNAYQTHETFVDPRLPSRATQGFKFEYYFADIDEMTYCS